jgi:hypothetical protein
VRALAGLCARARCEKQRTSVKCARR